MTFPLLFSLVNWAKEVDVLVHLVLYAFLLIFRPGIREFQKKLHSTEPGFANF